MNKLLKLFVDFIYRTSSKRKKFESRTNEKVLAADASKGISTMRNADIKRGANWVASQRAVILLTNTQIVCGKWTIPLDIVSDAKLVKVKSLFGGGQILKIDTINNESYQFGMQINDEWINQTALKLKVEDGKIKMSAFSWIIRIIAIGYLIYWLLLKFQLV